MKRKLCALLAALLMLAGMRGAWTAAGAEAQYDVELLVLVYLCGTDLETRGGAATGDLIEMLDADLPEDGPVAVLLQTGGTRAWQNEAVDSGTAQRFLIQDDMYVAEENLGQLDMGDPDTLAEFIQYAAENISARRYGLVLWDHGGGSAGGVCYDELTDNALSAAGIHGALSKAGVHFEFIGFDACLMSTIETAAAVEPFANYMIASEELEPGTGWAYDEWLRALNADPYMDGADIGRAAVDSFIETSLVYDPNDYVTLSVTDLGELGALLEATDALGEALQGAMDVGQFAPIARARAGMRAFGDFMDVGSDMVDIAAVAHALRDIAPDAASSLRAALKRAVVYSRSSSNVETASGLSILLPQKAQSAGAQYLPDYDALARMPGYAAFMGDYVDRLMSGDHVFSPPPITAQPLDASDQGTASWFSSFIQGVQQAQAMGDPGEQDALPEMTDEDLFQAAQAFGDEVYTIQLSQADMDSLGYVEAALLQYAYDEVGDGYGEDVYFDYGLTQDVHVDWDTGMVYGLFDGNWPTLEGQMVPMYDQIVTADYARSVIPAMVNGEEMYLLVVFNGANPGGLVVGYTAGYDDNGNPARGYARLERGDRITPLYDLMWWDEDDEVQTETYEGQQIIVGAEPPEFGYEAVESGSYSYALCLNDVFGDYQYTDFVNLHFE